MNSNEFYIHATWRVSVKQENDFIVFHGNLHQLMEKVETEK